MKKKLRKSRHPVIYNSISNTSFTGERAHLLQADWHVLKMWRVSSAIVCSCAKKCMKYVSIIRKRCIKYVYRMYTSKYVHIKSAGTYHIILAVNKFNTVTALKMQSADPKSFPWSLCSSNGYLKALNFKF